MMMWKKEEIVEIVGIVDMGAIQGGKVKGSERRRGGWGEMGDIGDEGDGGLNMRVRSC